QIRLLTEQNAALTVRVAGLEARLNIPPKTPGNSSLPPSKGEKANRAAKVKKPRKGRPGVTRKLAENPDHVREVFAGTCPGCGKAASPGCRDKLFVFVTRNDVPPTNNVSEQR